MISKLTILHTKIINYFIPKSTFISLLSIICIFKHLTYPYQYSFLFDSHIIIQKIFKYMDDTKKKNQQNNDKKNDKKKDKKKEEDLSLEDRQLKERIDHQVELLLSKEQKDSEAGITNLISIVKDATKTMTSVPKPFKFLRVHYKPICEYYNTLPTSEHKKQLANFLSVLSMTFSQRNTRASLGYLLQGTQGNQYKTWGYEYVSNLASDIGQQFELRQQNSQPFDDLIKLVDEIVPFFVQNNAEHDAIDLLLIVDKLQDIKKYVSINNFNKVNLYLSSSSNYSADNQEFVKTLTILYDISLNLSEYTNALRVAIKLDDYDKIKQLFDECPDQIIKKQLAFNSARQKIYIPDLNDQETKIISNLYLSEFYIELAKDLNVHEPKKPQEVFKAHLEQKNKENVTESHTKLFNIYTNAFVNAGLKRDTLMIDDPEADEKKQPYIHQLKEQGHQIAAVASIGLIHSWNPECINDHLYQYYQNQGDFVAAGACLGIGLSAAGTNDENDISFALLEEPARNRSNNVKNCAILGLGFAYAGRSREDIQQLLLQSVNSQTVPFEQSAFAALSLGLVFIGRCNQTVANGIIQSLINRSKNKKQQLDSHWTRMFAVGLGLVFMGTQTKSDAILKEIEKIDHPIKKWIQIMVESIAYIGSGNVLKVQKMSNEFSSGNKYSDVALLGYALIASSEEVGNQMGMRFINHALHFATPETKKIIPLALAVFSLSNPRINVMDTLQKLAYDTDSDLACKSIMALGLIGAGTNNSRLADMFRKLAGYYSKESQIVFCIRIAQGLLYMGKGMLTIDPKYSQKFLLSKVGMAGIVIFLTALYDIGQTILSKHHYFIFYLSLSMYPKFLFTLNDKLQQMKISVRVGQAVDVVGQAGKPKKITGFQTHQTPVLIQHGERAELASEEFIPIQDIVLENFVILRKNPDYVAEQQKPRKKTSL